MTTTAQPISVPDIDLLLSGLVWNDTPGTPLTITYNFLQQLPPTLFAPTTGETSEATGWAPLTAAEQTLATQAFAEIAAVANITFQASDNLGADVLIGTDNQTVTAAYTSSTGTPVLSDGKLQFVQLHIEVANNQNMPVNEFLNDILHEIANSTGLKDLATPTPLTPPQNSLTYSVESYTNGGNDYDVFAPGGMQAVTPQILDIVAWQYLYGANESGFTPSTLGTTQSATGIDHTYSFTDHTAPMTVWIGSMVSGLNSFDFSACTGILTIDLTPGTVSSTGQNPPGTTLVTGTGATEDLSNQPYQNVGIAYGTAIQIGIADATAGATLMANATPGTADLLIGGAKAADSFVAGGGYDIFVAAGGVDTAEFHDPAADYKIVAGANGDLMVIDQAASPQDGITVLVGDFTTLQFSDKTLAELPAAPTSATGGLSILATAAIAQADLDSLQGFVAKGYVSTILLTDAGVTTLSVTAAQLSADAAALTDISGNFTISVANPGADATLAGIAGHSTTVVFNGPADTYTIAGDGGSLMVGSDHLSDVQALQFSDFTELVASQTTLAGAAVTSAEITTLYAAALAREPDIAGLGFYETYAAANPTVGIVTYAEYFLSSSEYTSNPAHDYEETETGEAQFIIDTYQNLLHRAPEAGAVPYYEAVMDPMLATLTPGTAAYTQALLVAHAIVLSYFSQSPEFLSDVQVTASNPASAQHWLVLT